MKKKKKKKEKKRMMKRFLFKNIKMKEKEAIERIILFE